MTDFDWTVLDQLTEEVGAEILSRLLRTFYNEAAAKIAEFDKLSAANTDKAEMHRAVHSLKSAAGSFGASALAALAAEIEQKIEDGVWAHNPAAIAELAARFDAFKFAIVKRGITV
ncbi:MAG: Hpt domain-containing protein [Tagaea sp.]|nr:Hpt domain-containing protein [Tagaea sp.]